MRRFAWLGIELGVASALGAQTFDAAPTFRAGVQPVAIVAADFDRDGRIDLAIANAASSDVSILIGDGHGGFTTRIGPGGLTGLVSLAPADFNRDGKVDLAAGTTSGAWILPGDGAGGFGVPIACGGNGLVAAADVDADGKADLVGAAGALVWIARGDGAGGCAAAAFHAVGMDLSAIDATDIDGDGRPELLATDRGQHLLAVLPNLGGGGFGAPAYLALGSAAYPSDLVATDFDLDGHIDVAVAAPGSESIVMLAGDGRGALLVRDIVKPAARATTLAAGDVDGDGWPDLLAADGGAGDVLLLRGNAAGSVSPPSGGHAVGEAPVALVVADLDADGRLDAAVANQGGWSGSGEGDVTILLGDGAGGFPDARATLLIERHPLALTAADLDRDGRIDLVSVNQASGSLSVLRGTPAGFAAARHLAVSADVRDVAVADFDQDGWPDLAASHFTGDAVSLLRSTGDGGFGQPVPFAVGVAPTALVTGDFDGNGTADAVAAAWGSDAATVLLGDGHGGFQRAGDHPVGYEPRAVDAADWNRDGLLDLAVANWGSSTLSILMGDGRGGFARALSLPSGPQPVAVVARDVDGDGRVDLIVANECLWESTGTVSFWRGDGAGGFALPATYTVGRGPYALAVADLDLDGRLDVVTANALGHSVSILVGTDGGSLLRRRDLPVGFAPTALVAEDLDGDGRTDLAVATAAPGYGRIVLLRNLTPAADLAVAIDNGGPQAWPGAGVTYAITVANHGPLPVSSLSLPWTPSPLLHDLERTVSTGEYDPASGAWTGLDLGPGDHAVLTLVGTLDPMAVGTLVQSVTVATPPGIADPTLSNNAASDVDAIVSAADLALRLGASPDPVAFGDVLTYTVRVLNRGPLAAAGMVLELDLPTAVTFLPWPASPAACAETGGHVSCTLGELDAGAATVLELRSRANFELSASSRAAVRAATFDPDDRNDSAIVTTAIRPGFGRELSHGFRGSIPSGGDEWYRLRQRPRSSYEIVIDDTPLAEIRLERVASDLRTTLQQAAHSAGTRSLRWRNEGLGTLDTQAIRVRSAGPRTPRTYRIRAYETTGRFPRFNNVGTSATIVVLQNVSAEPVQGTLWFWDVAGTLQAARVFELPARGVRTFDTRKSVPAGAGSITVTHDARHGELAGKVVALDPTTGFVAESLMEVRPQ